MCLKPNEQKEGFHIRKPNLKRFLIQIKDIEHFYVGEKVITFEIVEKKRVVLQNVVLT